MRYTPQNTICARPFVRRRCRSATLMVIGSLFVATPAGAAPPLEILINLASQTVDWVDGTSIVQPVGPEDDNRFGLAFNVGYGLVVSSPLAAYAGRGTHYQTMFHFSEGNTVIDGMALFTTRPPGLNAVFSGTSEPGSPVLPGGFAPFLNLALGSVELAPIGSWDGGIRVTVVPAPGTIATCAVLGLGMNRRRRPMRTRTPR